ncbi:hypothetical protein RRG08_007782 [Elysia crispata]|uniref:Uncharacterized protein n=1 Tax=Elysia crispata TaxID=231223 RepID=A0AAE1E8M0_9GAST|nr:hypothetical protein RRG08_007782 [Elysia crispata]
MLEPVRLAAQRSVKRVSSVVKTVIKRTFPTALTLCSLFLRVLANAFMKHSDFLDTHNGRIAIGIEQLAPAQSTERRTDNKIFRDWDLLWSTF